MIQVPSIQQVPYAIYIKNENDLTDSTISEMNVLPVSIEIVPHKTISIQEAVVSEVIVRNQNYIHNYSKWIFFIFCGIPFMIGIMIVVGILNPEAVHI